MADVYPFRGLRYRLAPETDPGALLTPPFDTIDAAAQARYYDRHPHNVIRLELPREHEGDDAGENRYTRAAAHLRRWLNEGVLAPEERPAYYLLEERFDPGDGAAVTRTSFFAAVALSEYGEGRILPHEQTFKGPIQDRLQLLHHCWTNFSPIFSLYDDDGEAVAALAAARPPEPALACTGAGGVEQRLWVVDEPAALRRVQELLAPATLFIADGHHRYETARRFQQEAGAGTARPGPAWRPDRVLMVLTHLQDPGLVVLPTHRLVDPRLPLDGAGLLDALARRGRVAPVPGLAEPLNPGTGGADRAGAAPARAAAAALTAALDGAPPAAAGTHAFGLLLPGQAPRLVLLEPGEELARLAPGRSPAWRCLDVAVLHRLVFAELLDLAAVAAGPERTLLYTRDAAEAWSAVARSEAAGAFIMRSTPVESVIAVARAGDTMPQKSTFFYPKFQTGLVMNPLRDPSTA